MATRKIIKHLRSRSYTELGGDVIPAKPLPKQIEEGEIAINYLAGHERIFIKNSENNVVTFYPEGGGGTSVTVDNSLSTVSENPVQNKVITETILDNELTTAAALTNLNDNAGFNEDGKYVPLGTNVISEATTLSDAVDLLDEALGNIEDGDRKVYQKLDNGGIEGSYPILMTRLDNSQISDEMTDTAKFSEYLRYSPDDRELVLPNGTIDLTINADAKTVITPGNIVFNDNNPVATRADLDRKQDLLTIDTQLSTTSTNLVQNKVITQTIIDNELTTAAALTKMNDSAGFTNNGDYAPNGTNVVTNATSLAEAIDLLDDALGNVGGTDDKVAQTRIDATDSATDINYPLLLAHDRNPNGASAGANYSGITYNPRDNNGTLVLNSNSTSQLEMAHEYAEISPSRIIFSTGRVGDTDGTLTRTQYSGNAATATNATNDENGDRISTTYLKVANLNNAIAAYLENNGINGGEYYGTV